MATTSVTRGHHQQQQQQLHYPNLVDCHVETRSSTASSKPLVRLPAGCLEALRVAPEPPYDFALERSVLKKKEESDVHWSTMDPQATPEELEEKMVCRLKSVTGASEDVCVSLLESNSYDLKTSIEAYFQSKDE